MTYIETYLDHNVMVDLVTGRTDYGMAQIVAKKHTGHIFPYSPFHLEEIAVILLTNIEEEDQMRHINGHLEVLREVSNLVEYIPGGDGPIQLIKEDPLVSLKERVLKDYWITAECSDLEEFIDSQRSQEHFEKYSAKIGQIPKGQIRSRETIRDEVGVDRRGLAHADPSKVLFDDRLTQIIAEKARNYGLEVDGFPHGSALRENHDLTRRTIDCLMRVLNAAGFYADRSGKHRSYMFDVGHTIYATRAASFVVGDTGLSKRAAAIFAFLEAETKIISPSDFFKQPTKQQEAEQEPRRDDLY